MTDKRISVHLSAVSEDDSLATNTYEGTRYLKEEQLLQDGSIYVKIQLITTNHIDVPEHIRMSLPVPDDIVGR